MGEISKAIASTGASPRTMAAMQAFVDALARTGSIKFAHGPAGWSYGSRYYTKLWERYPPFHDACDDALIAHAGMLHKELNDAALGDGRWEKPSERALIALNKAHNREFFDPPRQVDATVAGEVQHFHTLVPATQSLEQLAVASAAALPAVVIDVEVEDDLSDLEDE